MSNNEAVIENNRTEKRKFAIIAVILVILLAIASLAVIQLNRNEEVFATVSVDVNPSLQLHLNDALRVISAEARNPEAKALMSGVQFKNMFWQDAVARWTELVIEEYPEKSELVLISAVMPENALALKNQLEAMRNDDTVGRLRLREVEILYSNDENIVGEARANGLSVGRQMLMNQARIVNGNGSITAQEIEAAPLAQMIRTMLHGENRDMTGLKTAAAAQNMGEFAGENAPSEPRATNTEQNREQNRPDDVTAPEQAQTIRQTIRETINQNEIVPGENKESSPSGPAESAQGATETNRSGETAMQTEQNMGSSAHGPTARISNQD
jgi:hypothetical protein